MAKKHKIIRLSFDVYDNDDNEKIDVVFSATTNKGEMVYPAWMSLEYAIKKTKEACSILLKADSYKLTKDTLRSQSVAEVKK